MESSVKTQVALAAVVLLLGAGLGFLLRGSGGSNSGEELHRMSQRMAALESRLDANEQATQRTLEQLDQRLSFSSGAPHVGNPPALLLSPQDRLQQLQRQAVQLRQNLDKTFDALTPGPPNDTAPQRVNNAFVNKDVLQAPELPVSENVDCRSTMCLIRARFAPNQDGSDWTNRMLLELSDTLPNASVTGVPLPDGGNEVRIYAARAGVNDPFNRAKPPSR